MRSGIIGLTVVAVSALGFSATAVDKARAYVTKRPEGAYAALALQFLVEIEARRMLDSTGQLVDGRRSLVGDLVFRPAGRTKVIKIYGESATSSEGKELREPLAGSKNTTVRQAQKALEYLQIRLKRLQRDTTRCDRIRRKRPYLDCIADAVDQFAAEVEKMPRTEHWVAPVAVPALRETAQRIRATNEINVARAAVASSAETVRKSISLVQAGGEDQVARMEIGQRSVVLNSLAIVDQSLVKAVGI